MDSDDSQQQDVRFLAQERILDALLRALALEQPRLINTLKAVLSDTELTHTGKPDSSHGLHQQIRDRVDSAASFAADHGSEPAA